jgi:hypothetical protein
LGYLHFALFDFVGSPEYFQGIGSQVIFSLASASREAQHL